METPSTQRLAGKVEHLAAQRDRRADAVSVWQLIDSRSVGGAERHITTLARALNRCGLHAEAVQFADYGPNLWSEQLTDAGVARRVLDGSLVHLVSALRAERPGLLHTHGYKAGILGRAAALPLGIPLVSTFHAGLRSPLPLGAYEWLDECTSFLGGRIAVSDDIARRLPFSSGVIPSWVATSAVAPTGNLPQRVGFVGRLSEEKRPEFFCWLAMHAPRNLEWHVYGDGPLRPQLERRYGSKVRFHGIVADLELVWSTLGLLVMPSRFEGIPLAALEALSHGVPVLASRVGGLPSIAIQGRTGWLFEADDPAEALSLVEAWWQLNADEQSRLRRSCWEHVRDVFSERVMLPKILSVYRRSGLRIAPGSIDAAPAAARPKTILTRAP